MEQGTVVYAVFQEGVYRHDCPGVFLTKESAIDAARAAMLAEPDNYHSYDVVPFELGVRAVTEPDAIALVMGICDKCPPEIVPKGSIIVSHRCRRHLE